MSWIPCSTFVHHSCYNAYEAPQSEQENALSSCSTKSCIKCCTYLVHVAILSRFLMKSFCLPLQFLFYSLLFLESSFGFILKIIWAESRVFYFYLSHSAVACVSKLCCILEWKNNQTVVVDSLERVKKKWIKTCWIKSKWAEGMHSWGWEREQGYINQELERLKLLQIQSLCYTLSFGNLT